MKIFTFHTDKFRGSIGFAVIETTDDEIILSRQNELLESLRDNKKDKSLDLLFLAVVNIVSLHSNVLLLGPLEKNLACAAFPSLNDHDLAINQSRGDSNLYFLGNRVSRKLDYIPVITRVITKNGWDPSNL
jgi:inorganic pyrophosphatase/exopolyphosphatase